MRIKDYLDEILNIIAKHPFVVSQSISLEERPPDTAFITGSITFTNGSKLHFKEFVVFETAGFKILKFGYNYLAQDGAMIFRYDNALDPQAKNLSTYPEHKHMPPKMLPAKRPSFKEVLKEVSGLIEVKK